jgi:hypothetical protein
MLLVERGRMANLFVRPNRPMRPAEAATADDLPTADPLAAVQRNGKRVPIPPVGCSPPATLRFVRAASYAGGALKAGTFRRGEIKTPLISSIVGDLGRALISERRGSVRWVTRLSMVSRQ